MLSIFSKAFKFGNLALVVVLFNECFVITIHIAEEDLAVTCAHCKVIVETIGTGSELLIELKRNVERLLDLQFAQVQVSDEAVCVTDDSVIFRARRYVLSIASKHESYGTCLLCWPINDLIECFSREKPDII